MSDVAIEAPAAHKNASEGSLAVCSSIARATGPSLCSIWFLIKELYENAMRLDSLIPGAKQSALRVFRYGWAAAGLSILLRFPERAFLRKSFEQLWPASAGRPGRQSRSLLPPICFDTIVQRPQAGQNA